MQINPDNIYERLVTLGEEWADLHAAAELAEELKRTLVSELGVDSGLTSATARESFALRHPRYIEHVEGMVEARKAANRAKVKYDSARVWAELKRTEAANLRATMREAP